MRNRTQRSYRASNRRQTCPVFFELLEPRQLFSAITEFVAPTAGTNIQGIAATGDGSVWFAEYNANQLGHVNPDGQVTELPLPTGVVAPSQMINGANGDAWFLAASPTQYYNLQNRLGRIGADGSVQVWPLPHIADTLALDHDGHVVVAGLDGSWVAWVNGDGTIAT